MICPILMVKIKTPILFVLLGFVALTADAADLRGQVKAQIKSRTVTAEAAAAVVTFVPAASAPKVKVDSRRRYEMTTDRKAFQPRVLVVPVGATVRFPNRDPILHNVFSVSGGNRFDLGLYGSGEGKPMKFSAAGVVRVFCNVHYGMVGYIVVVDTPYVSRPDAAGNFVLRGLPPGPGTLTVWHERGKTWSQRLEVKNSGGAPVEVVLSLSKPRVPTHRNKSGRSYSGSRRDRYRKPPL